jgi:hypothetical protein
MVLMIKQGKILLSRVLYYVLKTRWKKIYIKTYCFLLFIHMFQTKSISIKSDNDISLLNSKLPRSKLEAMIEWVSYWQTDWLTTCSNMDIVWFDAYAYAKSSWCKEGWSSEDVLLQCQMRSWTRRYWILMQLKNWTTCSNMDFYSVLYVRKVQFTNCLCMTHEHFMF